MSQAVISIGLIGFEGREKDLLEVFFSSSDARGQVLAMPERSAALIVNLDSRNALNAFERWAVAQPERPVIAVVGGLELPPGLIALRRPLTLSALKQALRQVCLKLAETVELVQSVDRGAQPAASTVGAQYGIDLEAFRDLVSEAQALVAAGTENTPMPVTAAGRVSPDALLVWSEARRRELVQNACGSLPDLNLATESERRRLVMNLDGRLLSVVLQAVASAHREAVEVEITGVPGHLVYQPATDRFSYNLDPELLLQMSSSRFAPGELGYCRREELMPLSLKSVRRDELLWLLALMTLQGRVADSGIVDQPRQLYGMPDFTRLLDIPHGRQIACLWLAAPRTALEIIRALQIPQRFVFSFMAAADAAGLFERK